MNTTLEDLTLLGSEYAGSLSKKLTHPIELGSVLSFDMNGGGRMLHMLICHHIGYQGWREAPRFIKFCLNKIEQDKRLYGTTGKMGFSIVHIGNGPIGTRDGSDPEENLRAIKESRLPVTLYRRPRVSLEREKLFQFPPLDIVPKRVMYARHANFLF